MSFRPAVATALICCSLPAFAVDWKTLRPEGYVSDFAHVIDQQSRVELEDYAARVEKATGAELAFVTLPSLEGEPIEDVTNDIFHAWGVGQKKEDDGAMVLLSVGDRKSRLEVAGGLGGILPDGMAGMLLDDMRPALRGGQYGAAMIAAAQRLGSTIAESKGVTIPGPALVTRVPRERRDSIPWPLIFIGIFLVLLIFRRRGGGGALLRRRRFRRRVLVRSITWSGTKLGQRMVRRGPRRGWIRRL